MWASELVRFGRWMFVLPTLFTLSSVFCGVYAIVTTAGSPSPEQFYRASLAVFFAIFFDMADGRVARLTKTQSDFGVQLDSLADVISFGVAPGIIAYRWSLIHYGVFGIGVAFVFVACAALRLARFNVLAKKSTSMKYFIGLPTPLAAGLVVSLVMFHQRAIAQPVTHTAQIIILLLVLSYLMISNIRYRTFKDVTVGKRSLTVLFLVLFTFVGVALRIRPTFAILSFFCGYIVLGLAEEIIFFKRRRIEDHSRPSHSPPVSP